MPDSESSRQRLVPESRTNARSEGATVDYNRDCTILMYPEVREPDGTRSPNELPSSRRYASGTPSISALSMPKRNVSNAFAIHHGIRGAQQPLINGTLRVLFYRAWKKIALYVSHLPSDRIYFCLPPLLYTMNRSHISNRNKNHSVKCPLPRGFFFFSCVTTTVLENRRQLRISLETSVERKPMNRRATLPRETSTIISWLRRHYRRTKRSG